MNLDNLQKLYVHELKDLHSAEPHLVETLSEMETFASDSSGKEAYHDHLQETKQHVFLAMTK